MIKKVEKIWFNGKLVDWDKANVHVLTHTLHYGTGVFEGIRFYTTEEGPAVFRLKEHVDRLFYSAKSLGLKMRFNKKEITKAILKTIKTNKIKDGYIRPLVFIGYGQMGLKLKNPVINTAIIIWPWSKYLHSDYIKVKITDIIRIHPKSTVMGAKICGHYINSMLASSEAVADGYTEALLLDYKGYVAEGSAENFFIVKNKTLITPPKGTILLGITRDSIIKLALDIGYKVKERRITVSDAKNADEAFMTGTAAKITPVHQIDNRKIGHGKACKGHTGHITKKLITAYDDVLHGRNKKYKRWLTFVR